MSHGSAAAIPTPTLERASKAFRCLPTSRLLAADLAGSGLGASTNATELAAKTVPAMGEVIAFPTRAGHMCMCGEPQVAEQRWFFIKVVSCCNRRERLGGQV